MIYGSLYGLIAKITARGGRGGDGSPAIERKSRTRYRFTGGNGGKGGDLYVKAYNGVGSLAHIKSYKIHAAQDGASGSGQCRNGKSGDNLELRVPLYTCIYKEISDEDETLNRSPDNKELDFIRSLSSQNESYLLCSGGRGGLGSAALSRRHTEIPQQLLSGKKGDSSSFLLVYAPPLDIVFLVGDHIFSEEDEAKKQIDFFQCYRDRYSYYSCCIVMPPFNSKIALILRDSKQLVYIVQDIEDIDGMSSLDNSDEDKRYLILVDDGKKINLLELMNSDRKLVKRIIDLTDERQDRANYRVFKERKYREIDI